MEKNNSRDEGNPKTKCNPTTQSPWRRPALQLAFILFSVLGFELQSQASQIFESRSSSNFKTLAPVAPDISFLQGSWSFDVPNLRVSAQVAHQVVFVGTSEGRAKKEELLNDGYTCVLKPQQRYLCTKHEVPSALPSRLINRVRNEWESCEIIFSEPLSSPTLESEGDLVETWRIHQKVQLCGKIYEDYRWIRTGGIEKIFIGEPSEATFVITAPSKLAMVLSEGHSKNDFHFWNYQLEIDLRN